MVRSDLKSFMYVSSQLRSVAAAPILSDPKIPDALVRKMNNEIALAKGQSIPDFLVSEAERYRGDERMILLRAAQLIQRDWY